MTFIRYKQRGQKWYAYQVTPYWDKETQKPKQKSTYLGVADHKGGTYSKPERPTSQHTEKAIVDFGDVFALHQVAHADQLTLILQQSIPGGADLLPLLFYQILEGKAMHLCQDWAQNSAVCRLYPKAQLGSQAISRTIQMLGQESIQRAFFERYVAHFFQGQRTVLIDSTDLPNAIHASLSAFGYGSDGIQQKMGCLMLVDQASKLPLYFRALQGDLTDISTLQLTLHEIKRIGLKTNSAILDAGYFSEDNVRFLCEQGIDFVTRMPKTRTVFKNLVNEAGVLENHDHAVRYGDRSVFMKTSKIELDEHQLWAYVILDPSKRAADIQNILRKSKDDGLSPQQVNEKLAYAGFFVLVSRQAIDQNDVLPTYYIRQNIEQIFGFAKANIHTLPLRVHSDVAMRGYLMLVFLSIVLFVLVRKKLGNQATVEKAMLILRGLKAKVYEKDLVPQELNRKSKDIFTALGVIVPTNLGI